MEHFRLDLANIAYSSLKFYNRKKKKLENITEEEHNALNQLLSLDDIIIQKADKGNVIVVLDRSTYIDKMENILSDVSKFTPITFEEENGDLKYILEKEKEIKDFLQALVGKGVITAEEKKKMDPTGSVPGTLYGNCKVHKEVPIGEIPPMRPILSAVDTPSYKLENI